MADLLAGSEYNRPLSNREEILNKATSIPN